MVSRTSTRRETVARNQGKVSQSNASVTQKPTLDRRPIRAKKRHCGVLAMRGTHKHTNPITLPGSHALATLTPSLGCQWSAAHRHMRVQLGEAWSGLLQD